MRRSLRLAGALVTALALSLSVGARALGASAQIVGGTPVPQGTLPWVAHITVTAGATASGCSGTVIAPNVVLTAAHCVTDLATMTLEPVEAIGVVTASVDWTSPAAQASGVTKVVVPAGFTKYSLGDGSQYTDEDIALLELATPTTAPAVTLATDPADADLYGAGESAEMAGWGYTKAADSTAVTRLVSAPTVVQADAECADGDLWGSGAQFDPGDQMCGLHAPADDTSLCRGDSGGPLLSDASGSWIQIGLAIYTEACATSEPSFYTRIDTWSDWITAQVAELAPPTANTGTARPAASTAQLNGQVRLDGSAASFAFQWGATSRYGHSTPAGSSSGGATRVAVSAGISGLTAKSIYHYRLVVTSAGGISYGTDRTFVTPASPTLAGATGTLARRFSGRHHKRWSSAPSRGRGPTVQARPGRRS